ncbi:hypothetical protein LJR220_001095 [Bradyrhizobium sp. LjRoot220]|uniref:hypothetical protein n=1 Tax=Bradyrhizobium sp. LjRoot220 TaxID=3342284 RepID=UPI003ED08F0E
MSETQAVTRGSASNSRDNGTTAIISAADFLYLAAAPTFAIMALLTSVFGGGSLDALCGASPLSGMVPMYLLMSAFHLAPWLKLLSQRRNSVRRC